MRTGNMKTGAQLIADERQRQVDAEGYDRIEDAHHRHGELAIAAACYAVAGLTIAGMPIEVVEAREYKPMVPPTIIGCDAWPWGPSADKRAKHQRLRRLVIAGALLAAEIDRLQLENEDPGS